MSWAEMGSLPWEGRGEEGSWAVMQSGALRRRMLGAAGSCPFPVPRVGRGAPDTKEKVCA